MSRDTHTYQEEINNAFNSIQECIEYDIRNFDPYEEEEGEELPNNGNFQILVEFNGEYIHFGEKYYYIDTPEDIEELKNKIIEYYNYLDTGNIMGKYLILYMRNCGPCYTAHEL
jgi:hypothetical protein